MESINLGHRVAIRVDASREIGTGHFMRCVTVANSLARYGIGTVFFSRGLDASHEDILEKNKHELFRLVRKPSAHSNRTNASVTKTLHADWLTVPQDADAEECIEELKKYSWLCLIVDHYGIDCLWESKVEPYISNIIVVDDLADRSHKCVLLIDQNLGREALDYSGLVPSDCILLLGPPFALLRPEFSQLRSESTTLKNKSGDFNILISMGGVDRDNYTQKILAILDKCDIAHDTHIVVILGKSSPWIDEITQMSLNYNHDIDVFVGVDNMAEVMMNADIAIGAAGATSWERCCLGVPTLCFVIAENQRMGSIALEKSGAIVTMDIASCTPNMLQSKIENLAGAEVYAAMQSNCLKIVDGKGLDRVVTAFSELIDRFPNVCIETLSDHHAGVSEDGL